MDMTFSCFVSEQEGSQDIVSSESGHPYCNVLMKLLRSLRLEKGNVVRLVRCVCCNSCIGQCCLIFVFVEIYSIGMSRYEVHLTVTHYHSCMCPYDHW